MCSIALEMWRDRAVFDHGEGYDDVVRQLDDALDRRDAGDLSHSGYVGMLKRILERHPEFVDGHAHLAYALMEEGKPKLALRSCLLAMRLCEDAVPADFRGRIEWGSFDNRPFLRAAHGAVLCWLRLGRRREAVALMERMLVWNPNDNQGIRYLIGSQYLRCGEIDKAERIFEKESATYPPYRYEHALLRLRAGDPVSAATSLRLGFIANGYVAEILSGNADPAPLVVWHGSNLAEPETAHDYLEHCGDLWRRTPAALAFLRWLHMHPKVLAERAGLLECQEALRWEFDFHRRRAILDRQEALLDSIDVGLSAEIVRKRTDRRGEEVVPWRPEPTGRRRRPAGATASDACSPRSEPSAAAHPIVGHGRDLASS